MPRKMYRNVEDVPQPEERPGSGTPRSAKEAALARMAETKRNVAESQARGKAEMKRRRAEPEVSMTEMSEDESQALAHTLEEDFEAASDRVIEAEDKLRSEPNIENAKAVEFAREKAQELFIASEEALPEGRSRRKSKATLEREAREAGHQANVAELVSGYQQETDTRHKELQGMVGELVKDFEGEKKSKKSAAEKAERSRTLEAEKADNLKRMQEMGGVWGGESYFLLSERNEEIEAELAKLGGRTKEKKAKAVEVPMTEEMMVAGEPTPEDRVADARKTIDFMNGYEQEIVARQRAVQAELKKYGIKDAAQIDAEMEVISPELREKSIGLKPGLWYKLTRMGRNLMGIERPPEVKQLLKKYAELEGEMNEQLHKRREAEAELMAAHAAAGHEVSTGAVSTATLRSMERRMRSGSGGSGLDVSSMLNKIMPVGADQLHLEQELESLKDIGEGSLQKELAAVRALRMLEEDIQDSMQNLAGKKDEVTLEDAQMYKDRLQELQARVTNLDNEAGKTKEASEAAKNAEAALAQYRRMVNTTIADLQRGVRESGKGSRPGSVIGMRAGTKGTYGTSTPDRRVVSLSKMETADTKERKESEASKAAERVNKDVQMYRSIKWRKELIDTINSNEAVRSAMHAVYEAYKKRAKEMMEQGELNLTTGSPDPALDYALNLYRLYARKENGKHQYSEKICQAASEEINHTDELLGVNWDAGRTTDRLVSALLRGLPSVMVEPGYVAEAAAKKEEEEMELQDSDLEEVVEEPIPLKRLKPQRPSLEIPTTEVRERIDREARESFEASLTDTTPEQPLPHIKRALSEEEQEAVEEAGAVEPIIERKRVSTREQIERTREAFNQLRNDFRETFGIQSPDQSKFASIIEQKKLRPGNDGAGLRRRIEELNALVEALPEGDRAREIGSQEVARFRALVDKYVGKEPEPAWMKEVARKQVERALNEGERLNMIEALNGKSLGLSNKNRDRLKEMFGQKWMEQYVETYNLYRQAKPTDEEARAARALLEEANGILNLKTPMELLAGESAAVQKEIRRATKRAEKRAAALEEQSGAQAEPETPPAEDEGQVISLADARAAREKKKKKGA